jgi:hypothetical protein
MEGWAGRRAESSRAAGLRLSGHGFRVAAMAITQKPPRRRERARRVPRRPVGNHDRRQPLAEIQLIRGEVRARVPRKGGSPTQTGKTESRNGNRAVPRATRCRSTIDATVLAGDVQVRDRLEGGFAHRRGYDPAGPVRPVLGVLDGHVARWGTDVAKSAVPAHPLYVDPEARRGRSVLGR